MGRQSYHAKNYDYAIQWLTEALARIPSTNEIDAGPVIPNRNSSTSSSKINTTSSPVSLDPNTKPKLVPVGKVPKDEILDYLHWAQNIKKTLEVGKDFLSQMTGIELDAFVEEVAQVMAGQKEKSAQKDLAHHYKSLCRGTQSKNEGGPSNPRLVCQYSTRENNPFYLIGPVKEELVNLEPSIWSFKDIIYDREIEAIKMLARPKVTFTH